MPVESDSADSPVDPTKLVLLVDLANFRPRGDAKKVFLRNGRWWTFDKKEVTNLQYIDGCLSELGRQTPGSIIISFCDQNVQKSLDGEDWIEIERRSQLSIYDNDKVFFTQSKTADDALTRAATELGSPIISHDKFRAEGYVGLVFDQSFDIETKSFRFSQMDNGRYVGTQLEAWWSEQIGHLSTEWMESNEREAAELLIRQQVRDLTFEFLLTEEVTHNPIVPENALQWFETRKQERLAKREVQRAEVQSRVESAVGFTNPETVIYADEWLRMEQYQGRVVTLVGRLVDSESGQLIEWFRNYRPISVVGDTIPEIYGKDRFAVVTGRLELSDGVLSIHLDPAQHNGYRWFADVVAGRPIYLQGEDPLDEIEPEQWRFPSFLPSLKFVRRMRLTRQPVESSQYFSVSEKEPLGDFPLDEPLAHELEVPKVVTAPATLTRIDPPQQEFEAPEVITPAPTQTQEDLTPPVIRMPEKAVQLPRPIIEVESEQTTDSQESEYSGRPRRLLIGIVIAITAIATAVAKSILF